MEGRGQATLRTTALLSVGVLVVHELRYRIAFGGDAHSALAASGHSYLGVVTPLIAMLAMLGVASWVQRVASGGGSASARRGGIWLALTGALVTVFCVQELLEGVLTTGHPDGLEGIFGDCGWLAIPVSMAVGGVALAVVRLAGAAPLRGVATRLVTLHRDDSAEPGRPSPDSPRRPPLLRHLAGRAPPLPA